MRAPLVGLSLESVPGILRILPLCLRAALRPIYGSWSSRPATSAGVIPSRTAPRTSERSGFTPHRRAGNVTLSQRLTITGKTSEARLACISHIPSGMVDALLPRWPFSDARLRRWAQTRVSMPHWISVLAGEWSLARPNVAQTLLSVPLTEPPPLRARSLLSIPLMGLV